MSNDFKKQNRNDSEKKIKDDKEKSKNIKLWQDEADVKESFDSKFQKYFDYKIYIDEIENMRKIESKILSPHRPITEPDNLQKYQSKSPEMETKLLSRKKEREETESPKDDNEQLPYEESLGPQPILVDQAKLNDKRLYAGTNINATEAYMLAQYVQQGKRIPRRGEVGITQDEIEKYEQLGYVMSGSRHKKMTAARLKREQIIYSAEEKRALAIYNLEQQQRKELNVINDLKYMWSSKKDDDF